MTQICEKRPLMQTYVESCISVENKTPELSVRRIDNNGGHRATEIEEREIFGWAWQFHDSKVWLQCNIDVKFQGHQNWPQHETYLYLNSILLD